MTLLPPPAPGAVPGAATDGVDWAREVPLRRADTEIPAPRVATLLRNDRRPVDDRVQLLRTPCCLPDSFFMG